MAAFDKLRFYIIKRHKGNKNMRICIEMYGEAYTSSAIGQQVTRLEFPSIPAWQQYTGICTNNIRSHRGLFLI